jgi:hypothetical protein
MDRRILELALETLEARRAAIGSEIEALKREMIVPPATTPKEAMVVIAKAKRRIRSAAYRKAQSERMKALWAKRKADKAQATGAKGKKR